MLEYLPTREAPSQGADKYYGAVASGYDAKRENSPKHLVEQKIITDLLADLPPETTVIDCPVGTGRFIPFYAEKGFHVLGIDKSRDMLMEAAKKGEACGAIGELRLGDVRGTGLPDQAIDVAVNCRITRWLSPEDCQNMFREMQRVAKKRIIWTARVANHVHARSLELFEAALQPGWKITQNIPGYEMDYRILMAERTA